MWLDDLYHSLDPIALSLGPLVVRWYGLAYLFGFLAAGVVMARVARRWHIDLGSEDIVTLVTGMACGVLVGARLGYVLFYGKGYYLAHPLAILSLGEGGIRGMSFHGGLVGAVIGTYLANRSLGHSFATICDLVAIGAPIGLFLGRCANFVNGELWGKPTTLPWGVMFDDAGGGAVYRHPSQLYEALLEGVLMFCILYLLSRKVPPRPQGTFLGAFLALYGCLRFLVEFVRLPDEHMGYLAWGWLTMGQALSLPLAAAGALALLVAKRRGVAQH
ncbi:MAG: prolipoprotein diacylglyceryl transferase [Acidobacteriota bacterium]|nr:prolipoprotein diacylglyceryl transferase [Acidobacteriota bacterium]